MALNPYFNAKREDLEQWLADAQGDLAAGSTTGAWGAADSNATLVVAMPPLRRIELILRELNRKFPAEFPSEEVLRVTQTAARFNDG